jgi:hypothetical protein
MSKREMQSWREVGRKMKRKVGGVIEVKEVDLEERTKALEAD